MVTMTVVTGIMETLSMADTEPTIAKEPFGRIAEGIEVDLYTLTNNHGMRVRIMTYGASLVSLEVPDRQAELGNVVLGFDTLCEYLAGHPYFGATVGRVANRIAKGIFFLDGVKYELATNDGPNHLHGGDKGFDKVVWKPKPFEKKGRVGIRFSHYSHDGEEGYPGNLQASVTYSLTDENELRLYYKATTDAPTPVNLTHHSYFNLAGAGSGDILGHELLLDADQFTPVEETLIPTGRIEDVQGTPMDFTRLTTIGKRIDQVEGGYDHNYVLRNQEGSEALAARVHEPGTGRVLEILTTEPGIQFYSGNFLDGVKGAGGAVFAKHHGFCLETQHFPDSVNQPDFPSVILEPRRIYLHTTVLRFSTLPMK